MIQETEGEVKGKKKKALKVGGCKLFYKDDVQLTDELYTNYAEALLDGTVSTNSFLGKMIQQSVQRIAIDANKDGDLALRAIKELNFISKRTQDYFDSKKAVDTDFCRYLLRSKLFPHQIKVYDDSSHKITMLWGRRAGKTHLAVRLALKHVLEKDEKPRSCVIIGLTLEKTANLYWQQLKDAINDSHINVKHIDNGNYAIQFSNGNIIKLWGNNSKAEREKLRGRDDSMYVIDEMQSQAGLYYLFTDILGPIIKGRNGYFVCLGTAPLIAGTFWENILNDDAWSHSSATMQDNPTIPNYEHALETILKENHWQEDNITFRREYLGEIAYDTERMILPKATYYEELPQDFKPIKCYIGVDFGWTDYSSIAPILFDKDWNGYLYDEWKENKTSSSVIVDNIKAKVDAIQKKFNIPLEDIKVIADSSHQQVSADVYNQGVTNIQNAYKLEENYQWARLAEALDLGDLKIKKDSPFEFERLRLSWQWSEERGCVVYKLDEDVQHPDIADSVKYAWNTAMSDRNSSV